MYKLFSSHDQYLYLIRLLSIIVDTRLILKGYYLDIQNIDFRIIFGFSLYVVFLLVILATYFERTF